MTTMAGETVGAAAGFFRDLLLRALLAAVVGALVSGGIIYGAFDQALRGVESAIDGVGHRLGAIDTRLGDMDARLRKIELGLATDAAGTDDLAQRVALGDRDASAMVMLLWQITSPESLSDPVRLAALRHELTVLCGRIEGRRMMISSSGPAMFGDPCRLAP